MLGGIVKGESVTFCFPAADIAIAMELVGAEGMQVVWWRVAVARVAKASKTLES